MSIASRIEAIEQHLTDDYSVLTLAGADLTNVDKNILNLKPTWKERLLYFMNNGTQQVWDNWEKVNGTGETLTLNNTEEAPMSLVYKGNTYQNTTTGKNLLNVPSSYSVTGIASVSVNLQEGTYYINCGKVTKGGDSNPVILIGNAWTYLTDNMQTTLTIQTATLVRFYSNGYNYSASQGITSVIENLMISINGGEYEPYTNGASPNPDYPQPIQVVSGNNSIEVCGLNILKKQGYGTPYSDSSYWLGTVTALTPLQDGWATFSADNSSGSSVAYRNMMIKGGNVKYKPSTDYTIFVELDDLSLDNATGNMLYLSQGANAQDPFNSGEKYITYAQASNKVFKFNVTTKADLTNTLAFRTFAVVPAGKNVSYKIRAMIVEGNYEKNTYESYTGESYPISLGDIQLLHIPNTNYYDKIDKSNNKNLINLTTFSGAFNTTTYTNMGNVLEVKNKYGSISRTLDISSNTYKQTNTNAYDISQTWKFINLKPNTQYTVSCNVSTNMTSGNINLFGAQRAYNVGNVSTTFTANASGEIEYDLMFYGSAGTGKYVELSNIMLNEGTTALEYEPYGTGWYVKKEIGKYNLSSTPFSAFNSSANNTTRIVWYSIGRNYQGDIALCDKLPNNINVWNADTQAIAVSYSTGYVIVRINKSIVGTTEEEINTYLSNNDLIFYSPLATPTYTLIEDTTLISQLETIKKSYEGQTNITQENNDMPFELDVEALKEM